MLSKAAVSHGARARIPNVLSLMMCFGFCEVHLHVTELKRLAFLGTYGAPKNSLNASNEFARAEWLRNVIICA
jgi:hypothetical protein